MNICKTFIIVALLSGTLLADTKSSIESFVKNIDNFTQVINEPKVKRDPTLKATIKGIDLDKNGLRDEVEKVIYQSLKFSKDVNVSIYKQTLDIAKMMQPKNPPIKDSINKHEIYCHYEALPDVVKGEIDLDFLYTMVLDTKERAKAFNSSLESSDTSLGEEICQ